MKKNRPLLGAAALLSVLLVTACGGTQNTPDPGASDTPPTSSAPDAPQTVRVGVIPATPLAALHLGVEKGYFADAGLELELVPGPAGPTAVAGVQSGSIDIGISPPDYLITSRAQGIDVVAIANASAVPPGGTGGAKIVVPAESDITEASDLSGRTLGSFGITGSNAVSAKAGIDASGGDASTVELVHLEFPVMLGALERGDIDAAVLGEPFLSQALGSGEVRVLLDYYPLVFPDGINVTVWFTSESQLENDADMVDRFTQAIERAATFADENPDEVRAIIPTFTQMTSEQLEAVELPIFDQAISQASFADLLVLIEKYDGFSEDVDLTDVLRQ